MADAVTSQVILDGDRLYIAKFTDISDGTGEAAALKIDVSTLKADSNGHACNGVKINKIWAQTYGMGVDILWDADTDVICETIPADVMYKMCYSDFGGISNNAGTGKTGDVMFTTVGASNGDRYTIILECIKTYANPTTYQGNSMGAPTSSNLYGEPGPFELQVARGQIAGHSVIQIFGYNADLDTSEESIWPDGGTVPHPTVASVLDIVSTSTDDDGSPAGTGARTVFIEGLNTTYEVVSETVTLNGTTNVQTVNSYMYVNQFYVATVGSGGANAGEITAKVGATLYDIIAIGYNNRTTAHYCVPAGYTGYLAEGIITAGQASGSTGVTAYLKQHGPDGVLRVGAVSTLNNGAVQYDFTFPYIIPEKNCVGASAIGQAVNNSVSAFFNVVLIKNTL